MSCPASQLECEWNGKPLPDKLTTTEFLIVKELAKRPGVIKERAHLMDIAYKENSEIEDRTIDSHVKRIRKKCKKVEVYTIRYLKIQMIFRHLNIRNYMDNCIYY